MFSFALAIEPKEAVVIGYGAVGKATAKSLLRRGYKVWVYDINPDATTNLDPRIQSGRRDEVLSHGHLLISATGRSSLVPGDDDRLPEGAVLANAGSGNTELGCSDDFFREASSRHGHATEENSRCCDVFRCLKVDLGATGDTETLCHRVVETESGKELLFLRSGYVVNMEMGLPPEYAQLILSLLYAGLVQAKTQKGKGLVPLDHDIQSFIIGAAREHLADHGLTLEEPDFRQLQSWAV